VWTCLPEMNTYRGLSGIDSAVFVLLAVMILSESIADRQHGWTAMCTAVLLAFAGKVGYECVTDATLFVDSAAASMIPIPLAHVVGGIVGLVCGVCASRTATGTKEPDMRVRRRLPSDCQPVRLCPANAGE
jgi:hypothetical protein